MKRRGLEIDSKHNMPKTQNKARLIDVKVATTMFPIKMG